MPDVKTLDSTMHYQDSGHGTPFVFLHGNPGSSHTWRRILPGIGPGRLLAPDLIGMGQSGKPDIAYAFDDHARYLDAWFDAAGLARTIRRSFRLGRSPRPPEPPRRSGTQNPRDHRQGRGRAAA